MSLRWYRTPKLVVFGPEAPVRDVARAIESNHIGAIVVQDQGRVVGMVTDRDLTIRVVGAGLDPTTTPTGLVMTSPVATLPPTATQGDALLVMQRLGVRRIPLVEDERLVGMVTLDDLLLDETVPLEQVAAVIESQIGEGGVARAPASQRSVGRALGTFGRFRNEVRAEAGLDTAEQAETALNVVLSALVQRLTPGEAKDFIAQLPSLLQPGLRALPAGPDKSITRQLLETEISQRLDVGPQRAAEILNAVGSCISECISPGQVEDMRGQLPEELRSILPSLSMSARA